MTSDRPQRAAAKSKLRMLEPGEVSNYDSVDVETSSDPGNQPAADERLEPGEVENDDSSDSSLPDILDAPPGVVFDHHDGHVTVHHLPSNSRVSLKQVSNLASHVRGGIRLSRGNSQVRFQDS